MQITYDAETGAAYISLIPEDGSFVPRTGVSLEEVEALGETGAELVLDLDEEGRLVGLEVLSPELLLRRETIQAMRDGG